MCTQNGLFEKAGAEESKEGGECLFSAIFCMDHADYAPSEFFHSRRQLPTVMVATTTTIERK
jgi:hypothetical protein